MLGPHQKQRRAEKIILHVNHVFRQYADLNKHVIRIKMLPLVLSMMVICIWTLFLKESFIDFSEFLHNWLEIYGIIREMFPKIPGVALIYIIFFSLCSMSGFGMGRNSAFGLSNSFSSSIFNGTGKQTLHDTEHTHTHTSTKKSLVVSQCMLFWRLTERSICRRERKRDWAGPVRFSCLS